MGSGAVPISLLDETPQSASLHILGLAPSSAPAAILPDGVCAVSATPDAAPPSRVRWLVLVLLMFSMWGMFSTYDAPGSLAISLEEEYGITITQLGLFYTGWALPNMVLAPVAGVVCDRLGASTVVLVSHLCGAIGCIVFAFFIGNFPVMFAGRVITAVGYEALCICARKQTVQLFPDLQSLCVAILSTAPMIATILTFIGLPILAEKYSCQVAFWVPAVMSVISGILGACALLLMRFIARPAETPGATQPEKLLFDVESASETTPLSKKSVLVEDIVPESTGSANTGLFSHVRQLFRRIAALPGIFWLFCLGAFTLQGAIWPFAAMAPEFFANALGKSPTHAGVLAAVITFVALVASPLVGFACDKGVPRVPVGMLAAVVQILAFTALAYSWTVPLFSVVGLGMVLACYSPSILSAIPVIGTIQESSSVLVCPW
eukprot:TRINITY_DN427_c0_g1_i1.p1 TRINITY_DN427_c0_g1~~TRINITY_DN427_c0_g1_i1.p1  ORF type:complete len:435 (-),score=56.10 TRINITY_DN427_c0_g1_i1:399-1703(-)